jgi:queuine/archaeosine tRNA-ribosyltransferase
MVRKPALRLLTFHNLHFFNAYVARLREQIKSGEL